MKLPLPEVIDPHSTEREVLSLWRSSEQADAERDYRKGENHRPGIDQCDGSAGLSSSRRQHRKKETRRNEDCRERHTDSDCPKEGAREDCSVRDYLANKRENHNDARVGVPGMEEILAEWVVHVPASLVHQGGQQKIPTVLNRRHRDEDDAAHHSGFASHGFSFKKQLRRAF